MEATALNAIFTREGYNVHCLTEQSHFSPEEVLAGEVLLFGFRTSAYKPKPKAPYLAGLLDAIRKVNKPCMWFSGDPAYLTPPNWLKISRYYVPWAQSVSRKLGIILPTTRLPVWPEVFGPLHMPPVAEAGAICYAGYARKRGQLLEGLFDTDLYTSITINCTLPYSTLKHLNVPKLDNWADVAKAYRQAGASLIIGDPGYEHFTLWSHRILQSFAMGTLTIVHRSLIVSETVEQELHKAGCLIVETNSDISQALCASGDMLSELLERQQYTLKGLYCNE